MRTRQRSTVSALDSIAALAALVVSLGAGCGNDDALSAAPIGAIGSACQVAGDCGYAGALCVTSGFPGGYCTVDCRAVNCPTGTICAQLGEDAVCAATCTTDEQCRNGYYCEFNPGAPFGVCDARPTPTPTLDVGLDSGSDAAPDAGTNDSGSPDGRDTASDATPPDTTPPDGTANYGATCATAADCTAASPLDSRCLVAAQGFPGGYCSASCDPARNGCGGDAVCIRTSAGGLCIAGCAETTTCREGYECCAAGDGAGCLPEGMLATCADPTPPDDPPPTDEGQLGAACSADTDCAAGSEPQCFRQIPGGYCTSACTSDADCGTGNVCQSLGFGPDLCIAGCATSDDCREGLACCDLGFGDACLPDFVCR